MNIIKQKVEAKSHSLQEKWSFDIEAIAIDSQFAVEFDKEVAKIMQEEMDWEILSKSLVEYGWTKISIIEPYHIVEKWVEENIQGKYKVRHNTWLFESEKDATMFILRWS